MAENNGKNGGNGKPTKDPDTVKFSDLLKKIGPALEKTSMGLIDPDRLAQVALNATIKQPMLLRCTQVSVASALITAASLGLEPNTPAQHCFLVPRRNKRKGAELSRKLEKYVEVWEAQFTMGAAGLIYLGYNAKVVTSVTAREIYKGEEYEFIGGTPFDQVIHKPSRKINHSVEHGTSEKGDDFGINIEAVYCVLHVPNGPSICEWMYSEQIEDIRMRDFIRDTGPWLTDYAMMARKTVIKRGFKYVPMGSKLALAIEVDGRAAVGKSYGDLIALPPGLDLGDDEPVDNEPEAPSTGDRIKDGIKNAKAKDEAAGKEKTAKKKAGTTDKPTTARKRKSNKKTEKKPEQDGLDLEGGKNGQK